MAVLFRGNQRVVVPDAVASDYEADGWTSRRPAPEESPVGQSPEVPAEAPTETRPPRRRKADR